MEYIPPDPDVKAIIRLVLENWKDMSFGQRAVFTRVVEFYSNPPAVVYPGGDVPWARVVKP